MFEKLRDMLVEQLDLDADAIKVDTDLVEDLGCDSLDLYQLICDVEEEYGVDIEVSEDLRTIGDIIKVIEQN